ncbi:MAG: ATPase central domain protein [Sphingomonas bacterium]|nr:ATPase central domain protein [Sphingomonas bacterium]
MTMSAAAPQPSETPPTPEAWADANRHAIALGVDWLRCRLAGEPAEPARHAYEQARSALAAADTPAAIDRLAALFELAQFDEDVLLLGLAAARHADVAARCAALNDRGGFDPATVHLALGLLAAGAEAEALAWARLSPDGPLRRFRLIDGIVGAPTLRTPLTPDERVQRLLLGEDGEEPRLRSLLGDPGPTMPVERRSAAIAALALRVQRAGRPLAVLAGRTGSGRLATARSLAGQFGLGLAAFRPGPLGAVLDLLPLLGREAALGRFALLVTPQPGEVRSWLEERIDALVILLVEDAPDVPAETPLLRLDPLDHTDRVAMWTAALGARAAALDPPLAALADQFRLGPAEIATVAAGADPPWQACRVRAGRDLERLAERLVPSRDWDDLILPAEVTAQLRAVASQVRLRALVHHDRGFARKLPRGGGVAVLLAGPSGAGKTMAAEVVAGELGLDLFRIDLSRVVSKYIGETEKNLGAVFDAAEAGGAVLFFDEADALFGKRSEVKDSHDRYANIETSYLLQRMESFGGLALLATNLKANLDSAFLRRLRFVIDLPLPDAGLRREIWRKAFPAETPTDVLDWNALARLDIAGGNIAVIAVNAAFLAAADSMPVGMRHVAQATRAEFRKLDKDPSFAWREAWT